MGFEIFNNTDFGMTEFAQKINYQRALQGELARTIGAIEEVKSGARAPGPAGVGPASKSAIRAEGLGHPGAASGGHGCRQSRSRASSAWSPRRCRRSEPGAVTVLDQQGVALSRRADPGAEGEAGASGGLEAKREIEDYLLARWPRCSTRPSARAARS